LFGTPLLHVTGLKTRIMEAAEREDEPYDKFRVFVRTRLNYLNEKAVHPPSGC
jgi:hypothetical protein